MTDRFLFFLKRLREKLWFRPLVMCVLSATGAFFAKVADSLEVGELAPQVKVDTVEHLLSIMAASMLVMATFAVGSMVSAYASAAGTATPRSFPLVVADDVSQNSLSAFLAAFIFSVVALIAVENGYYQNAGRFTLLMLTLLVFAIVVLTFVRWVDSVARLGRLGATIDKVEAATMAALERRRLAPTLGANEVSSQSGQGLEVYSSSVGYVQRIDLLTLQGEAEKAKVRIEVAALPGSFVHPGKPLAFILDSELPSDELPIQNFADAFRIAHDRTFDEDPRFGLIVLGEIASRALSPGINDPGTAIDVLGTMTRLFLRWNTPLSEDKKKSTFFDRVAVPRLSPDDMLEDAFRVIARDGAGCIEVVVRLQKSLECLATIGHGPLRELAREHARRALARAEAALDFPRDRLCAREAAEFVID